MTFQKAEAPIGRRAFQWPTADSSSLSLIEAPHSLHEIIARPSLRVLGSACPPQNGQVTRKYLCSEGMSQLHLTVPAAEFQYRTSVPRCKVNQRVSTVFMLEVGRFYVPHS